ncbi:MAG: acyl-CoA dehydrogenase [Methylobacter sp.]|nr:MAG: acyl-CoA dehydrogenase [Methylobacter sp.]
MNAASSLPNDFPRLPDMDGIQQLIADRLKPRVTAIDLDGEYPQDFLQSLGAIGGFTGVVSPVYGGNGLGLSHTIEVMERTAKVCLSTAFLIWCQTACLRYLQLSDNDAVKSELLADLAGGRLLGGTGLSNTLKASTGIERALLKARRVAGGYAINGNLPWVSNLGQGHYFVTGCPLENDGRLVFFVVDCSQPDFRLQDGAHFTALEGTGTLACQFRDCLISDHRVLAHAEESEAYMAKIKPGMMLAQMGMGLGLISSCIELIDSVSSTQASINQYLDDQADDLLQVLAPAHRETYRLAALLDNDPNAQVMPNVLKVRLAGGELSLRAAQAAMLHQGAKGYLAHSAAQRKLREAYFVAIVTPAIKHLRRELARLNPPTH